MNPPPLPKPVPARKPASKGAIIIAIGILVLFIIIRANSDTEAIAPAPSPPIAATPPVAAVLATPAAVATVPPPATEARETDVPASRETLEKKALRGDYQAQRNLAYSLGHEFPISKLQSCAWRIVILNSGSSDVDDSDVENRYADCDRKLSPDVIYAASMQAITLQEKIETRRK